MEFVKDLRRLPVALRSSMVAGTVRPLSCVMKWPLGRVRGTRAGKVWVMVWHYHDDDLPGPDAAVALEVAGMPTAGGEARMTEYRVDETHSNAYAVWKKMGSPTAPRPEQYEQMRRASELTPMGPAKSLKVVEGKVRVESSLPRQAVALFVVEQP